MRSREHHEEETRPVRQPTPQSTVAKRREARRLWNEGEELSPESQLLLIRSGFATRITVHGTQTRVLL